MFLPYSFSHIHELFHYILIQALLFIYISSDLCGDHNKEFNLLLTYPLLNGVAKWQQLISPNLG